MKKTSLEIEGTGKKSFGFLGYLPALIIIPILVFILLKNLSSLSLVEIDFNAWPMLLSAFLIILHFTVSGLGWWLLLRFLGGKIPVYQAIRIAVLSLLGRYIPGKVWILLGKIYMSDKLGLSKKLVLVASSYELFFMNTSGLFVLCMVKLLFPRTLPEFWGCHVLMLSLVILIIVFPNLIVFSLNIALRLLKRSTISAKLNRLQALLALLYYSGLWVITGLSFYFFIRAIFKDFSFPLLLGALILANVIGLLFIIAPGGLGIREGTLTYILSLGGIPPAQAVIIALACRVWSTAGELLVVLPLLLFKGREKISGEISCGLADNQS